MNKGVCFFSIFLFALSFCGCYPVHSLEKYPSKTEYYKDANSAFVGKEVKVSLAQSDSVLYAEDVIIQNDSISLTTLKEWENKTLYWKDIVSTAYYNKDYDNLCAVFKLKNGESINAEFVKVNPDSSIDYKMLNIRSIKLPIKDIKNIRYKNYWGLPAGLILGVLGGIGTGITWYTIRENRPKHADPDGRPTGSNEQSNFGYLFWPSVAGPSIGIIAGWTIGGRTTWEFNK